VKIVLAHYHLKTGGVTSVLKQQIRAIEKDCEVLVLTGEIPDLPFPAEIKLIPGFGYGSGSSIKKFSPEEVAEEIVKAIYSKWKDGCDILHIHNPLLAKNKDFLKILKELQKKKMRLFLQIHDFAEDGRPLAYFTEDEYIPNCHYGVINSRDYKILLASGLKKEGLHKLSNTIEPIEVKNYDTKIKKYILYPIRAIRRKNIGEAILLSLFFKNNETLFITQPPNSPIDVTSYNGWKEFVKKNRLNVLFEAGLKYDFKQLVNKAEFLITTSITEGFGFSFLEPWTAGKIICGRKLPEICYDFEQNNIKLDHLYEKMLVPVEWIDKRNFYKRWRSSVLRACSLFNYKINNKDIEKSFSAITDNNIDFGLLNESFQKQVITYILSDKTEKNRMQSLNQHLLTVGEIPDREHIIQNNMKAVLTNYNTSTYKEKLLGIYSKACKKQVTQCIDKKILLSEFLNLDKFSLLKWGDYVK